MIDIKYHRGYNKRNDSTKEVSGMGWTIGLPSLKLNNAGGKSKHCGDFGSVAAEALQERQGRDPDIDPERADLNVYEGFQTAAELQEYSRQHVEQLRDAKGRKLRKDAVVMCATIIKPAEAYMATLTDEQQLQLLKDAGDCLRSIIGQENEKARAFHCDEIAKHLHVFWEPMTADGRLCAKEVHNLQFFARLNKEMPEYLRSKGWDIEDCQAYDAAAQELMSDQEKAEKRRKRGRSSAVYKAEAEREAAALQQQVTALKGTVEEITQEKENLQNELQEAQKATQEAEKALREVETKAAALNAAVQPPEVLQGIVPKKAMFGQVKLHQDDYAVVRQTAEGGAIAKAAANEMLSGWHDMEQAMAEMAAENEKMRQQEFQIKMLRAENDRLIQENTRYKSDNSRLRKEIERMNRVLLGQAGFWSKLASHLPGMLGDAIFLRCMEKATGMAFKDIWEFNDYYQSIQEDLKGSRSSVAAIKSQEQER